MWCPACQEHVIVDTLRRPAADDHVVIEDVCTACRRTIRRREVKDDAWCGRET